MKQIEFTKMHGAGNDYIYVNADKFPIENPSQCSIKWSKPHIGIGSDGLILIDRSKVADFRMRIYNADGSAALMCGNGSRCVGKYVYEHGLTKKTTITLETLSGIKTLNLHLIDNRVDSVSVDMGQPEILCLNNDIEKFVSKPISVGNLNMKGTAVSMGNPHLVFFVDDVENFEIEKIGSLFERHPWFGDRTNVEFAQILSDNKIRMRVWERGSGITLACGTGACATLVAAVANGLVKRSASLVLDGGVLEIQWDEARNTIIMTGPAVTVFDGKINI